jgi:hypothetical protein
MDLVNAMAAYRPVVQVCVRDEVYLLRGTEWVFNLFIVRRCVICSGVRKGVIMVGEHCEGHCMRRL